MRLPSVIHYSICLVVASAPFVAESQSFPDKDDQQNRLISAVRQFANTKAAEDKFSGVVMLAKNGKPIFQAAYGLANKRNKAPNLTDTKFDLGSMPKMFTAVAIAQLQEAGKLAYSDKVGKFFPDFPNHVVRDQVTIDELLTHTAGLGNYFRPGFLEKRLKTVPEYLSFIEEEDLVGKPGEKFEYSNSGYVLLGAIVEKVSGQDFYEYVKDHILKPAGMVNTDYYSADDKISNAAVGYTRGMFMIRKPEASSASKGSPAGRLILEPDHTAGGGSQPGPMIFKPEDAPRNKAVPGASSDAASPTQSPPRHDNTEMHPYRGSPAGGAYSTASDMLKFVNALNNGKLLSPNSVSLLETGKVLTRPGGPKYGYGFDEWEDKGQIIVGHGGGGPGVNGIIQFYPQGEYTVIVLSNFDPPAAEEIAAKAREVLTNSSLTNAH